MIYGKFWEHQGQLCGPFSLGMKTLSSLPPVLGLEASWSHPQGTAPGFLKQGLGRASQWESLPHTRLVLVHSSGKREWEAKPHYLGLHGEASRVRLCRTEPGWASLAGVGVAAGAEANAKPHSRLHRPRFREHPPS